MAMVAWHARTDAAQAAGLVAAGAARAALLHALRRRDTDGLRGMAAVATRDLLVVLGPTALLPWVDGIHYCAPVPDVPGLWLPTRLAPDAPAELLYAALQRRCGHAALLLWHNPGLMLGLDGAQPISTSVLDWLDAECT